MLLVDLDPQGNLIEVLGYTASDRGEEERALAQGLMFGGTIEPLSEIRPNLDVIAGGPALD